MGIYNFQPRFVPYILDGTKTHTIRAERVHADGMGDWLHLYTGLRHKGARLLFRAPCVRTDFIKIAEDHRVFIGASVGFDDFPAPYGAGQYRGGFVELDQAEKDALAFRDGFRIPIRDSRCRTVGSFKLMMEFWDGRLPFTGTIIHWDYNRRSLAVQLRDMETHRSTVLASRGAPPLTGCSNSKEEHSVRRRSGV